MRCTSNQRHAVDVEAVAVVRSDTEIHESVCLMDGIRETAPSRNWRKRGAESMWMKSGPTFTWLLLCLWPVMGSVCGSWASLVSRTPLMESCTATSVPAQHSIITESQPMIRHSHRSLVLAHLMIHQHLSLLEAIKAVKPHRWLFPNRCGLWM